MERLIEQLPEGSTLLVTLAHKFASVGFSASAVTSFLKAGEVKAAVDCCVELNQWDQVRCDAGACLFVRMCFDGVHKYTQVLGVLNFESLIVLFNGRRTFTFCGSGTLHREMLPCPADSQMPRCPESDAPAVSLQAVQLAEKHQLPEIPVYLSKYANHLVEKDNICHAVELYKKVLYSPQDFRPGGGGGQAPELPCEQTPQNMHTGRMLFGHPNSGTRGYIIW